MTPQQTSAPLAAHSRFTIDNKVIVHFALPPKIFILQVQIHVFLVTVINTLSRRNSHAKIAMMENRTLISAEVPIHVQAAPNSTSMMEVHLPYVENALSRTSDIWLVRMPAQAVSRPINNLTIPKENVLNAVRRTSVSSNQKIPV